MNRLLAVMLLLIAAPALAEVDEELTDESFLSEVARHLYRWHLDEADVRPEVNRGAFVFQVRQIERELDEGDESRFAELSLPRLGIEVDLKKANYEIPELGVNVANESYKIVGVHRGAPTPDALDDTVEVEIAYDELRDRLFETRAALRPPDEALIAQMRTAALQEIQEHYEAHGEALPEGQQIVHIGPISPVSNEIWVFWQTGRLLLRFHSDMELSNPAVLEHDELSVELYDVDEQVVVSLDEVAGSNAYLTRDQVGRVLFNCTVFGRTIVSDQ